MKPDGHHAIENKQGRKDFFNVHAGNWLENCYTENGGDITESVRQSITRLFTFIPLSDCETVADIGCGDGILVNPILARIGKTARLFEIDCAEEMIKRNKERHRDERITFLTADVMDMPLEAESCDVVIAFSCFPHFENKQGALDTILSMLRPEGVLAIAHFNSSDELNDFHHAAHPAVMEDRLPKAETTAEMAKKSGLQVFQCFEESGFYLVAGKRSVN